MTNFSVTLMMAYLICHYFMLLQINYAINNYRHGLPARIAERHGHGSEMSPNKVEAHKTYDGEKHTGASISV